jgi:hypothetical protein
MTSSISGNPTVPLPVPFSLTIYPVSQRVANKELSTQRSDELARQRDAKRKAQHEVEMLALEWSKIMLEKTIHVALDPATDPALAAKLREQVLNRGIEQFLEALTAVSTIQGAIERTPPGQRIERDVTPTGTDDDLQQLLDDLEDD